MHYTSIDIKNFRGIKSLSLEGIKQFNVLVGNNNSGKSTVLEAIFLNSGPTNSRTYNIIQNLRGINNLKSFDTIFYQTNTNKQPEFKSKFTNGTEDRSLKISPLFKDNSISSMSSINQDLVGVKYKFTFKKQGKSVSFEAINKLNQEGNNLHIDIQTPKNYQESLKGVFLGGRNWDSNDFLLSLEQILVNRKKEELINSLQLAFPEINELSPLQSIIYVGTKESNSLYPIQIMGDGTNKYIKLILTVSANQNSIILIDEIENGLHHTKLSLLWEQLFKIAKANNNQLFITTHNAEILEGLLPVMEKSPEYADDFGLIKLNRNKDLKHTGTAFTFDEMRNLILTDNEIRGW
ncbi:MAG: ATP/GTP-binding protein [Bacteroidales bacterium]